MDISRELNDFSRILLNEDDVKHFRTLSEKTVNDFFQLKEQPSTPCYRMMDIP